VDPKYSQALILCDLPILTWAMERLVEAVVDNFSQKPTVSLTVSESDPYIDIYLSLTAQDCSIEKSTVSRINDLMAQREPTVSELSDLNPGFFIAKSAIDMHNGAISLDQKEKNGCGVTIALPVYLPDEEVIRHV
jgi:signal transduction histidine kinase